MQLTRLYFVALLSCVVLGCGGGGSSSSDSSSTTPVDITAPSIISREPAVNAIDVDPASDIVITFSENIVLNNAVIRLTAAEQTLTTNSTLTNNRLTLRITGANTAEGAARLTLTGVSDAAGNVMAATQLEWRYRTIVRDTTAPTLVETLPANSAVDVAVDSVIRIRFNETINAQNAHVDFRVGNGADTDPTIITTLRAESDTVIVTPQFSATPSGLVTMTVSGIRDVAGNQAESVRWQWSYITTPPADTVAPTIVSRNPANNATQVPTTATITAIFNESINIANASSTLTVNGQVTPHTLSAQNDRVTVQLGGNPLLEGDASIVLRGVRDLAGNVANDVTWSWRYVSSLPPTTGPLRSTKVVGAGVGANGYQDYGCIVDANRPSGWNTLFVNASATDGDGTRARPFQSISRAVTAAGSRSVICVATGTYSENINLGTQTRRMLIGSLNTTFTARDLEATPTTIMPANAANNIITVQAPTEFVLDGFVLTGTTQRGIEASAWDVGERIALRNNHIHHNGCQSVNSSTDCGGVDIGGGASVIVEVANNVIEENGGGHHGGGINIGGGTERINLIDQTTSSNDGFGDVVSMVSISANVHHNIIRNNRIYEASLPHGAGLAIGMNGDVHHNEFFGNDTVSDGDHYGVGGGLIGQHDRGGTASIALLKVYNNWFEANRAGKHGSAMFFDQLTVGYAYNNVIVKNIGTGAILVDGSCGDSCQGPSGNHGRNFVTILNNTIADNDGAGLAVQDSTAHVYYNIFWKNRQTGGDIYMSNGSPGADNIVRGAYNIININPSNFPLLTNSASGESDNSLLRSLTEQNYRVSDISGPLHPYHSNQQFVPAIQLPVMLQAPLDDFDGTSRPDGQGHYVFGAFGR